MYHDRELTVQAVHRADSWFPAEGHANSKHQAQLEAATVLTGALHASGDADGAALQCQTALSLADKDTPDGALPPSIIAAALKQAASFRFAQVWRGLLWCLLVVSMNVANMLAFTHLFMHSSRTHAG